MLSLGAIDTGSCKNPTVNPLIAPSKVSTFRGLLKDLWYEFNSATAIRMLSLGAIDTGSCTDDRRVPLVASSKVSPYR